MLNDAQLLKCYASGAPDHEEAFAELVRRHLNLVYSMALRMLGQDTHLAQDVDQLVFANLARRADIVSVAVVAAMMASVGGIAVRRYQRNREAAEAANEKFRTEQKLHLQPAMPILIKLITYAGEQGSTIPSSLAFADNSDGRFESIGRVVPNSTAAAPATILREKTSWRTDTGKRGRVYGYSDGHAQVLTTGDPGFEE